MSAEYLTFGDNRGTVRLPLSHCRSCGKAILWLKHAQSGKLAPINASAQSPTDQSFGNVEIDPHAGTWRVVPEAEMENFGPGTLHLNHFTDCPQRRQWKGEKA